jgi:hypothetical protein
MRGCVLHPRAAGGAGAGARFARPLLKGSGPAMSPWVALACGLMHGLRAEFTREPGEEALLRAMHGGAEALTAGSGLHAALGSERALAPRWAEQALPVGREGDAAHGPASGMNAGCAKHAIVTFVAAAVDVFVRVCACVRVADKRAVARGDELLVPHGRRVQGGAAMDCSYPGCATVLR